jgi:hypothetical protein
MVHRTSHLHFPVDPTPSALDLALAWNNLPQPITLTLTFHRRSGFEGSIAGPIILKVRRAGCSAGSTAMGRHDPGLFCQRKARQGGQGNPGYVT